MEKSQYNVRVDNAMSISFSVDTELNEAGTLSQFHFNLMIEKI